MPDGSVFASTARQGVTVDSRTSGENERRILRRDPDPHLFRPVTFRSVTARNRIALSPMCQYSAQDGLANDWHFIHLASRAIGGAGIVFTEAVHTEPRGRITRHDLGLWNDEQRDALSRIASCIHENGAIAGIQLGHAGRKASVGRPWEGTRPISPEQGGWRPVSATTCAYALDWPVPERLTVDAIQESLEALQNSARRARDAGFKVLELHAAHGYLVHQFLSPLSNDRNDIYGGSAAGRSRYLFECVDVIRKEWPDELPLFVRMSVTDWVEGGLTVEDTIGISRLLRETGKVDLIDCSSGGNDPRQQIPIHPGYQVDLSHAIRRAANIATGAVGLIHSPDMAEMIIASGLADIVLLGRTLLADPVWPLRAAAMLKAKNVTWPVQYERSNIFW